MKTTLRLLFLGILALLSTGAFAQYVPEWQIGTMRMKGGRLAIDNVKLDKETTLLIIDQVGGQDLVASWEKYSRQRGWGIGLTAGGYSLAAVGFAYGGVYLVGGLIASVFVAVGGQEAVDRVWEDLGPRVNIGAGVMLAGLAAGTTGVVLLCVGNHHLRKIADTCDAAGLTPVAPAARLTFGPTPSGAGLALRF